MRNKELYESLKKLSQQTLSLMNEGKGKCGKVAIERAMHYVIDSPQSASFAYSFFSEFERLFFLKVFPDSALTTLMDEALELMMADSEIAKHLPDQNSEEFKIVSFSGFCNCLIRKEEIMRNFLMNFVNASCARHDLNLDDKTFDEFYTYFEDEFYGSHIEIRVVAPLINFSSDSKEIAIKNDLKIIKFSPQDRVEIFAPTSKDPRLFQNLESNFVIEKTFKLKKVFDGAAGTDLKLYEDIEELQTVLRLFKPEKVGFDLIKIATRNPSVLEPKIRLHVGLSSCTYTGDKYNLNGVEKDAFLKLLNCYQNIKTLYSKNSKKVLANNIMMAIKRFHYAYGRPLYEDKLIDFIIAFEALFLKDDERDDMRYRLSLRTAYFLKNKEDDERERKGIYDHIYEAYGKRSKIVHGERAKDIELSSDFIAYIENYLRLSIKTVLEKSSYDKKHEDFINKLGLCILGFKEDSHAQQIV